jgi:hypothetical protein
MEEMVCQENNLFEKEGHERTHTDRHQELEPARTGSLADGKRHRAVPCRSDFQMDIFPSS